MSRPAISEKALQQSSVLTPSAVGGDRLMSLAPGTYDV
jgi:hypothetical protein